jgi:hypothetical protein
MPLYRPVSFCIRFHFVLKLWTLHYLCTCWGNISQVLWAIGYGPKLWIRLVPSSGKWLENHTPHTKQWLHHSRLKRRGHQPKKNYPWEWFTPSLLHPTISAGRQDFTTYLPLPPLSMTQGRDPGPWSNMPGGSPQWINITHSRPQEAAVLGAWHEGT